MVFELEDVEAEAILLLLDTHLDGVYSGCSLCRARSRISLGRDYVVTKGGLRPETLVILEKELKEWKSTQ